MSLRHGRGPFMQIFSAAEIVLPPTYNFVPV